VTKAVVGETSVERLFGWHTSTPAAEVLEPAVLLSAGIEKRGQCLAIKLWVATRSRVPPDVGDLFD
jgi:hypothetical protein